MTCNRIKFTITTLPNHLPIRILEEQLATARLSSRPGAAPIVPDEEPKSSGPHGTKAKPKGKGKRPGAKKAVVPKAATDGVWARIQAPPI